MSKGSKPRPIVDRKQFENNWDAIFNKPELETCPYCGITAEEVCDSLPPNLCEKAINHVYGNPTK